jgi:hypothetical protein
MILKRNIRYEFIYFLRGLSLKNIVIVTSIMLSSVVIGFSDALSFFTSSQSPVPKEWTLVRDEKNAKIVSIIIIIVGGLSVVSITEGTSSDVILSITKENIEDQLLDFSEQIKKEFHLSQESRVYIVMPVREKFLSWRLKIVCRTPSLDDRELNAAFSLNEGIYGWAIGECTMDNRHTSLAVSLDIRSLPPGYVHLSPNNKILLKDNLVGFYILPIFEQRNLCGEFIIDTGNSSDVELFRKDELTRKVVEWLSPKLPKFSLFWRLIRNGK